MVGVFNDEEFATQVPVHPSNGHTVQVGLYLSLSGAQMFCCEMIKMFDELPFFNGRIQPFFVNINVT